MATVHPGRRESIDNGHFPSTGKTLEHGFLLPQPHNDFWKICGLLFLGDKDALLCDDRKTYDIDKIRSLMTEKRIALNDTVRKARRLKGNASDKFLEVIEPVPLFGLLSEMPGCHAVATTGEKAAGIVAALTGTDIPRMGEMTLATVPPPDASESPGQLEIWRMPSTSRAYPLAVELKAEYYATLFRHLGIL